ncbi:DUF4348 domain-containing protein [Mucilaginibacter pineti]
MLSFFSYNNFQNKGIDSFSKTAFTKLVLTKSADTIDLKFDSFFNKFESDRSFQLSRIQFPLKVISITEDGRHIKFMKKSEWTYTNFVKIKNIELNKSSRTKSEMDVKLSITDTGVQVVYHFQIKNGKWWLCGITDMSD